MLVSHYYYWPVSCAQVAGFRCLFAKAKALQPHSHGMWKIPTLLKRLLYHPNGVLHGSLWIPIRANPNGHHIFHIFPHVSPRPGPLACQTISNDGENPGGQPPMVMTPRFHRSLDKNHVSVIGTSKWQVHLLISGSETSTHPQVTIVHNLA